MDSYDDWIDEWQHAITGGKRAESTVHDYVFLMRLFRTWLADQHPEVTAPHMTSRAIVREWAAWLASTGLGEATRRKRMLVLRLFLNYVTGEPDSGLDTNPAAGLELPSPHAKPVPVLDDAQLAALLRACEGASFVARRDTLAVRLLLDTGVRRAELVAVNVTDVDQRRQEIAVRGKGGDIRLAPYGNRTALAMRKYLRARENHPGAGSPALLLGTRLNAAFDWRLRGSGISVMLQRRGREARLGHLHPHMFRHTWAADMKAAGVHEDALERLAGWAPGSPMSRRYGNAVADEHARASARRLARGDRV